MYLYMIPLDVDIYRPAIGRRQATNTSFHS